MRYTAILIDDEAWTRDVLRSLGNWDALGIGIIAEASDGEYGLELISRLQPDIIVTDVKMPHMSGIELLNRLRESGNKAKTLFVSGYDDFDFIRNAMKLQANDYLLKPVKPDELNEQLERCVRELEEQKSRESLQNLDLQGFMNVEWVQEYKALRDSIYESLHSSNTDVLRARFQKLTGFIARQKDSSLSKSLVICMYFDFHNGLQRFIWESGCTIGEVFGDKPLSFVFSNEFSIEDMLRYIESLYSEAQKRIIHFSRTKNRIDIHKVRQYIDSNYLSGVTLEETAERFFVSKEYLSKVFKQEYGEGFSDYVIRLKMEKAKELLTVSKVPIKEIAQMTCYADQAHFHKAFKKYYGVTPGEMQRGIKN